MATKPYADTRLASYIEKRVLELRPRKSQSVIAGEAGFTSVNMITMLKTGASKLALDRVPALARALLFKLALEQQGGTAARAVEEIFGVVVTRNEAAWIEELREASEHADPNMTVRSRSALRGIFGK